MSLDSQQLVAFAAVIEEGSFDAAARRLIITPSAVSQRVKALEQAVGQVLVRREKPCMATDAGASLMRLAAQVGTLEREALREMGGDGAPIRVAIAVNADSFGTWMRSVLSRVPDGVLVDIRIEDQDHSAALLRAGVVMAAVTTEPKPIAGCRSESLGSMRYVGMASPAYVQRHLPGGILEAGLDAVRRAPMIRWDRRDALQDQFLRKLFRRDIVVPEHYVPTTAGNTDALRVGLGWGMMPEQLDRDGLVDVAPGRYLDVPLYWQHWKFESATLNAITSAVRDAAVVLRRQG
ncbi:LysR family transcriptional regulator ArgP [Mycobacterium sp. CBMA271]|uniref:LysR family transcriptional regulator ArgP n=1 Tax=unclassified Mycobacteroides TaxID=2618759 RepID=UPI00132222F2|nr:MULTISPECIES: LysR family transcriptional regulator ArgP [unclassified Mycobacteroides]MUM19455.1 transcriptional regulator ArgP [Mycobacteroides sp. CBMA 326]MUM21426.1 LysR family transcriptional regulator ArgP [Mycobacteroides sp. CBMA 271]